MLFLLSPAKALDFETPAPDVAHTQPLFVKQSAELIEVLKQKSPQQIAELMHLSDALSGLNAARYQAWSPQFTAKNAKQAVLAFNGDVYGGLDAKTLSGDDLAWAQDHLCILSGLYGVLRPLDYMQPYRLEMGTRLETAQGNNLYQFWGRATVHLFERTAAARYLARGGELGQPRIFQGGRYQGPEGAGGGVCVSGAAGRAVQNHQLHGQAGEGADGAVCRHPPCLDASGTDGV